MRKDMENVRLSTLKYVDSIKHTVIFATSRERMIQKLDILLEYCVSHGMVMNESKTKFMVMNGDASDREPFPLGDIIIKLCKSYVYLGAIFTADGSTASSLAAHAKEKRSQLNKLLIFFRNNPDMPFCVKRKVLEAAFNSSILYGCESWLDVSFQKMEVIYMSAIIVHFMVSVEIHRMIFV